jgi:hypothetical protein
LKRRAYTSPSVAHEKAREFQSPRGVGTVRHEALTSRMAAGWCAQKVLGVSLLGVALDANLCGRSKYTSEGLED